MLRTLGINKRRSLAWLLSIAVGSIAFALFLSFLATKMPLGPIGAYAIVFSALYFAIPDMIVSDLLGRQITPWTALTGVVAIVFWIAVALAVWFLLGGRVRSQHEAL